MRPMLCFVFYFDKMLVKIEYFKMPKVNYKSDNAITDDFKRECVERQKKNPRDVTGVCVG